MFRRYRVRATIEAALLFSKMFFFSSSEFQSSLTQYRLERPPSTFHCFVFATCETREFPEDCAILFFSVGYMKFLKRKASEKVS